VNVSLKSGFLKFFFKNLKKKLKFGLLRFLGFFVTALHVMQTRYSDENSVRLSVRLSHACIVTKRKKICPEIFYTVRKII